VVQRVSCISRVEDAWPQQKLVNDVNIW